LIQQIESLIELQKLDLEVDSLRKKAQAVPLAIEQTKQEFESHKTSLETIKQDLVKVQADKKQKELDLGGKEGEIKKHQGELFKIKNNKEYTALQAEIEKLKADKSVIDDEILKSMDATEVVNIRIKNEQEKLKAEESVLAGKLGILEQDLAKLNDQIAVNQSRRQALADKIPADSMSLYDRIRKSKKGLAIVEIKDNSSCGGCHITLPPQIINEVRKLEHLVLCENCSRILFYKGE
jgi:uncharacterized protein